jgi:hypothetical protein
MSPGSTFFEVFKWQRTALVRETVLCCRNWCCHKKKPNIFIRYIYSPTNIQFNHINCVTLSYMFRTVNSGSSSGTYHLKLHTFTLIGTIGMNNIKFIFMRLVGKYNSAGWKISSKSLFCSFTHIKIRYLNTPLFEVLDEELGIITSNPCCPTQR